MDAIRENSGSVLNIPSHVAKSAVGAAAPAADAEVLESTASEKPKGAFYSTKAIKRVAQKCIPLGLISIFGVSINRSNNNFGLRMVGMSS